MFGNVEVRATAAPLNHFASRDGEIYWADQDRAFAAREASIASLIAPTKAITPPTKLPAKANRPSPTGIA